MYKTEDKLNNETVRAFNKKNTVIKSATELTLLEQNIFNLFQYILTKAYNKSFATECVIPYSAFRHFMGSKLASSIASVESAFDSLNSKTITLNVLNQKGTRRLGVAGVSLIDGFFLPDDENECIRITIPQHIIDEIRESPAESGYTSNLLQITKKSKNRYTPRIYDFIYCYASARKEINPPKLTIDNFRAICGIPEGKYEKIAELNRKVIVPAMKEMKEKFNLEFTYNLEKIGRKVEYISFEFSAEQRKKAIDYVRKEEVNAISSEDDIFISYARKHSEEQNVKYFNESLLFDSVSHVENMEKDLHYKICLTNGKYELATFDEIVATLKYERLRRENMQATRPELHKILKPAEEAFNPSIVLPSKIEVA